MLGTVQVKDCLNCTHEHYFDSQYNAWLCTNPRCYCRNFQESTDSFANHQKYIQSMESITAVVRYMLEKIPQTRNLRNLAFVFAFYHFTIDLKIGAVFTQEMFLKMKDSESIRRCKQKLVEENADLKPFDPDFIEEKNLKELGILAWVLPYNVD